MAVERRAVVEKKGRKIPIKQHAPSRPLTVSEAAARSEDVGALQKQAAAFDPRHLPTKFSAGKSSQEYLPDETVYSQGDASDTVFFIQSGNVKLTVVSKSGKEAVIAILPEGSFFGESCLAGRPLRIATASAVERSSILRVAKPAMVALLHQEPEFAERFLAYLLSRNNRMEADLVDHLFNSSEKRLARLLLLMANFGQESKPIPLIAKLNQETLAEMVGTTRSRVSFFLNRFREMGFIEYGGSREHGSKGMHVHSSLVSVVLHD
ncbi:MAG: Crp/Fnr family transcriptional regulator [Candidatus Korobacteraceae bacterium]|jgi:CRP-like cAMP-binding protein